VFYFACNYRQWLHVEQNTEIISKFEIISDAQRVLKLFQNCFSDIEMENIHELQ